MTDVTIYHNPRCSKSRQTLQIIRDKGVEPVVVEYLNNPPTIDKLTKIIGLLGITPRELLRKGEAEYKENNLSDKSIVDDKIIEIMAKNPKLIERPIVVVDNKKAILGRPPENILDIM